MHGLYESMQREGKIGPLQMEDGQLKQKPYQDYPKWVTNADGKRVVVKTLQEEIAVAGKAPSEANDPLSAEKIDLLGELERMKAQNAETAELNAAMKAQLAELATAREALQSGIAKTQAITGGGSKFRPPAPIGSEAEKPSTIIPPQTEKAKS